MERYSSQNNIVKPKKKFPFEVLIVIILLLIVIGVFYWAFRGKKQEPAQQTSQQQTQAPPVEEPAKAAAINGVMVDPSKVQRPFAVMIENHPDARPQSGISQADIVYEALAEGGITRFMAVFQTQDVANIGPVRSARTYFNDWAQELCSVYAHVGGNSDALAYLHQGIPCLSNADQFFNDPYFTRIPSRKAPHNTYTSIAKLTALAQAHGFSMQPNYQPLTFKDDQAMQNPSATNISLNFSTPQFAVTYLYDAASNSYKRYTAGSPTIDAGDNQQVAAKDVVVQIVNNWPVASDTPFSISMGTRDGGKAYVFEDGKEIIGTWKVANGRTRYYDQSGNEIALNRGQLWIEIFPPDGTLTVK